MNKRLKKIYNPDNISALARHLQVSTATIHNWKKGRHKEHKSGHQGTINKYNLIMKGWTIECREQTS